MNAPSTATACAQAPEHPPADTNDRGVPAHAREFAAQLSALFDSDVEIVKRLNDAQHRLKHANDLLDSGLAPDALGLIDDTAATAIASSPVNALTGDGGPAANSPMLEALKQARWTIHRAFCTYQHASEQRRQLAVDVGELSQQLIQALRPAGWSADQARHANVHELAKPTHRPSAQRGSRLVR